MSREPHGPVRRLSMLVVGAMWVAVGVLLVYVCWPDDFGEAHRGRAYRTRNDVRWVLPGAGAIITIVGVRLIITAVTPYRRRSQEEEDAEGEYPYSWEDRSRLKQWGDGHKVGPPPWPDDW